MTEETPTGLDIGDRSQGYEITGDGSITGLKVAYVGTDGRDHDAGVTLIWLSDHRDQSALFDLARTYERLDHDALIGLRTVVRFSGGSAVVIGKEDGAPLSGETLDIWLKRRAPIGLRPVAKLFLPVLEALKALHDQGSAHGRLSTSQMLVTGDGALRLMAPWVAHGADPQTHYKQAQAPELISGQTPNPVSDIYSVAVLMYWAIAGKAPMSADERLTAQAQRDEDPLVPLADAATAVNFEVTSQLDTALRLHPATRPQSMDALIDLLRPHAEAADTEPTAETASAPTGPWSSPAAGSGATPPPLPQGKAPRSGQVPPIPRKKHTSTIGEAPPPPPSSGGTARKRKIGLGTVLSFALALGVAWLVASGDLFSNDRSGSEQTAPVGEPRDVNRTEPLEVDDAPRKGPRPQQLNDDSDSEDTALNSVDGVLEQFCNSRFTYQTARDGGTNALRAYLQRCQNVDSDYVDDAREALGID